MSETIVAKRYATALFQLGSERSKLETFDTELRAIKEVFRSNRNIITFLKHPRVTVDQKKQLINDSFKDVSKEILHTLMLLIDRHREEVILPVVDHFILQMNEANGIADATVYSVRPLSEREIKRISKTFAPKVDKRSLNLTNVVETSLLGGIRLRVGNRIFDGSVRGKLSRMERELVSKV